MPPMVVESRQRAESFTIAQTVLGGGAAVNSNVLYCKGYAAVVILARADVAGTVRIFERITAAGAEVETNSEATAADPTSGEQVVFLVLPVHGEYMRVRFTNGAVAQAAFQMSAYLLPVGPLADDGGGGGGGGGGGLNLGRITRSSTSQNLAAGSLSLSTALGVGWKPRWVALTFSAALSGSNQTLKIEVDSGLGASFDALVEKITLAPAGSAEDQAYLYAFPPEFALRAGDEIRVTLTNTGTPASTVSAQIIGERCGECGENG